MAASSGLRRARLVILITFALTLVGCTAGGTTSATDATPSRSAPASPAATDAEALFVELPEGLAYVDLPQDVEDQVRTRLVSSEASKIIESWAVRNVEEGSVPIGTVVAIRLNEQATSADEQGIVRGMEEAAGAEGEPVEVAGTSATYIEDEEIGMLVHVGDGTVFMVFGPEREEVERVFGTVVAGTASDDG